ncbi:hypothetical protein BTS2_1274 [Bacillus sp. TS-2]|nr:hypothetical protein BTS2_1274 [Bacillus sp. TS-2]
MAFTKKIKDEGSYVRDARPFLYPCTYVLASSFVYFKNGFQIRASIRPKCHNDKIPHLLNNLVKFEVVEVLALT